MPLAPRVGPTSVTWSRRPSSRWRSHVKIQGIWAAWNEIQYTYIYIYTHIFTEVIYIYIYVYVYIYIYIYIYIYKSYIYIYAYSDWYEYYLILIAIQDIWVANNLELQRRMPQAPENRAQFRSVPGSDLTALPVDGGRWRTRSSTITLW